MGINEILNQSSDWVEKYLPQVTNSIVITLLAVYGNDINAFIKQKLKDKHILVRYAGFILFMSFGYGILAVYMLPYIQKGLLLFGDKYLALVVVGFYLLICILATRKKQI
jgi:hypothetical protein